ncbi:MAG: glycoside hydrolase family 127 protein [Verrucomicrobia bacterium]|nr:glycoside hydrolase family 127 protein [Verrucomicrobiota bacterium]
MPPCPPARPVPRDRRPRWWRCLPLLAFAASCAQGAATDVLTPAAPGTVTVAGRLGDKLERSRHQRVYAQNLERILQPYRDRREENAGHWRCEYWGKWFTSAALAAAYAPTGTPRTKLNDAVRGLLATQTHDGYIGTYKPDKHLGIWDVWGRKYTLLGLIAAYDLTGDAAALAAARRVADHLMHEAPPGKFNLGENGIDVLKGLAPNSILEPMVLLHVRTGDARYLDFARSLVADWEKPNRFLPQGLQLIASAQQGVPPLRIASPKAYEMMSCFEGLCELYRVTGDPTYLDATVRFAHSIRRTELMIHGSGSNHELWCDGTRTQTELLEQPVETCVTVTWMKLCHQLLRLTGDPLWADEMEVSLYNALLGAMTPDGGWWAYFSPLAGQRVPSHFQHADVQMSCCTANGPRGLHLTPAWAVMRRGDGLAVNLYAPGRATPALADGTVVTLEQRTDYPAGDAITIEVSPARRTRFSLALRIPAWSKRTTLAVNGQAVAVRPGTYAILEREWSPGDRISLQLDLRGRAVPAPSGAPQLAVMRGPLVLALDNRLAQAQDVAVRLVADAEGYVALQPVKVKPAEVWLAFEVPFEVRPTHFFKHRTITLPMCDFASAGNGWNSASLFRTWLPQPLFLRQMFPTETWRLMGPELKECPPIPVLTPP